MLTVAPCHKRGQEMRQASDARIVAISKSR